MATKRCQPPGPALVSQIGISSPDPIGYPWPGGRSSPPSAQLSTCVFRSGPQPHTHPRGSGIVAIPVPSVWPNKLRSPHGFTALRFALALQARSRSIASAAHGGSEWGGGAHGTEEARNGRAGGSSSRLASTDTVTLCSLSQRRDWCAEEARPVGLGAVAEGGKKGGPGLAGNNRWVERSRPRCR